MADQRDVLKTKIWMVNPDGSKSEWMARVRYERSGDRFFVDVPPYLDPQIGLGHLRTKDEDSDSKPPKHGRIYGSSPQGAVSAVKRAVDEYEKSTHTKRKVLVYQLGYKKDGCEGVGFHFSDQQGEGTALQVDWDVCWEHTVGTEKQLSHDSKSANGGRFSIDDWKIMEWTPQRQKFFEMFELALDQLIHRIDSFLGDEKRLLEMIDAGRVPLLTGPAKKDR